MVQDLGFGMLDVRCGVQGLGFELSVSNLGCRVSCFGFWVKRVMGKR